METTFRQIIQGIHPVSEAACRSLEAIAREIHAPKGHLLMQAGRTETVLYFIRRGVVRAYAPSAGSDITFWFGQEGDPVLSMKSYVQQQPGYENIELLEDCVLYELNNESLQRLFLEHAELANWGRKLAEQELLRIEERLISAQFKTATERYNELASAHPSLMRRVALGHIASYLGITQVSLSRIRAAR